jgi:hypothetical protein
MWKIIKSLIFGDGEFIFSFIKSAPSAKDQIKMEGRI